MRKITAILTPLLAAMFTAQPSHADSFNPVHTQDNLETNAGSLVGGSTVYLNHYQPRQEIGIYQPPAGRFGHTFYDEADQSPTGRFFVFTEADSAGWSLEERVQTDLILYDQVNAETRKITGGDNYRHIDPAVSDNGYVAYVRTPVGDYTDTSLHDIYLYDPTSDIATRIDSDCTTGSPLTTDVIEDTFRRRHVAISGDGRYVAYGDPCNSGTDEIFLFYLYDRISNTTTTLPFPASTGAFLKMTHSGRLIFQGEEFTYDQATDFTGSGENIDCIDQDGDGWGQTQLGDRSCFIETFEADFARCDYIAAVTSNGAQTCAFASAEALSAANNSCTDWADFSSECGMQFRDSRSQLVNQYKSVVGEFQTTSLIEPAQIIGATLQTITPPPNNSEACVDLPPLGDGFGWNGSCTCSLENNQSDVNLVVTGASLQKDFAAMRVFNFPEACVGSGGIAVYDNNASGMLDYTTTIVPQFRAVDDFWPTRIRASENIIIGSSSIYNYSQTDIEDAVNNNKRQTLGGPSSIETVATVFEKNSIGEWEEIQILTDLNISFELSGDYLFAIEDNCCFFTNAINVYKKGPNGFEFHSRLIDSTKDVEGIEASGDTLVSAIDSGRFNVYRLVDDNWQLETTLANPRDPITVNSQEITHGGSRFSLSSDTVITSRATFVRTASNSWESFNHNQDMLEEYFSAERYNAQDDPVVISNNQALPDDVIGGIYRSYIFENNSWRLADTISGLVDSFVAAGNQRALIGDRVGQNAGRVTLVAVDSSGRFTGNSNDTTIESDNDISDSDTPVADVSDNDASDNDSPVTNVSGNDLADSDAPITDVPNNNVPDEDASVTALQNNDEVQSTTTIAALTDSEETLNTGGGSFQLFTLLFLLLIKRMARPLHPPRYLRIKSILNF